MFTGVVIGGIILIAALVAFSYWCVYRAGRERGYEECRLDRAQEALSARHAARHARTQPRAALARGGESSPAPHPAPRPAEGIMEPSANRWYLPSPGPIRSHTSPADIAPVILPAPGTYLPQPRRDSGPGTIAMARLALPATPGEMKAVTDEWIERMRAEEAAYRKELTA